MKRSSQVALLLMGVTTAGAGAYAVMPARDCAAPQQPAALTPGAIDSRILAPGAVPSATAAPCSPNRRSNWHWSSRSSNGSNGWRGLFSSSSSGSHTSLVPSSTSRGTSSRGGFGSIGHSFSSHSSGS